MKTAAGVWEQKKLEPSEHEYSLCCPKDISSAATSQASQWTSCFITSDHSVCMEWVRRKAKAEDLLETSFMLRPDVVCCSLFPSVCTALPWNSFCHSHVIIGRNEAWICFHLHKQSKLRSRLYVPCGCTPGHPVCLSHTSLQSDAAGCTWREAGLQWQETGMLGILCCSFQFLG